VLRSIRVLAAVLLAAACSDGNSPDSEAGAIQGEVHLLGPLPLPLNSGVVQLYASLEAMDQRQAFREAALAGGPADWTFQLEAVPAGTYYLGACFAFGCGTHSDTAGEPAPVKVRALETTTSVMAF
jgi:hypothetical protein